MSFFGRQNQRSSSVPPNQSRPGRSQSFSVPNPKRHNELLTLEKTDDKLRSSFHGQTEHQRESSQETIDDLNETIVNLKSSLMTHATSNAEALNQFDMLQKAHDKLYEEHVTLQEQMDDAVELLKYLKEEKVSNESKIKSLQSELQCFKQMTQDSVVSITIENLTKDKMNLETSLENSTRIKDEAVERASVLESQHLELQQKVASLEIIQQAYELQTKQTLSAEEKLIAFETEKDSMIITIKDLEKQLLELKSVETKESDKDLNSKLVKLQEDLNRSEDKLRTQKIEMNRLESKLNNCEDIIALNNDKVILKNREIVVLKSEVEDLKIRLVANNETATQQEAEMTSLKKQLSQVDEELIREKAEMQTHLDKLQQESFRYADDESQQSLEEQHERSFQSSTNNEEFIIKNERLQYQIQHLESQLQNERSKSEHEAKIYAQLEKEMQGRLAQRLAAHLKESEKSMKTRIREELEEEYSELIGQRQQQDYPSKSKSFTISEFDKESTKNTSSTAFQRELEEQLREQLRQVKDERERWQKEQEDFQNRVLLSKQQLDKIREGYRVKYDKERRRADDLENASQGFQIVIDTLHKELNSTKDQIEELQMQQSEKKLIERTSVENSDLDLKKEVEKFIEKEKKYHDHLKMMQVELNQLQSIDLECQRLGEEKADLVKKCKDLFEEHQLTLQEMEQLNAENEEFLKKIETLEIAASNMEKRNAKNSEQYKELESRYDKLAESNSQSLRESATKLEQTMIELDACKKARKDDEHNRAVIEAERDDLLQKLEVKSERFRELESENHKYVTKVQQLTRDIDDFHTSFDRDKADMEQKYLEQLDKLRSLKDSELESMKNNVSAIKGELASVIAEKDEVLLTNARQLSANNALESEISHLSSSIAHMEADRLELNKSLNGLRETSETRIQSLEKQNQDLKSSLNDIKDEMVLVTSDKASIEEELSTLHSKNKSMVTNRDSMKKGYEEQLQEMQAKIDVMVKTNTSLQAQVVDSQTAVTISNRDELEEVKKENYALQQELENTRFSLKEANSRNETLTSNCEEEFVGLQAKINSLVEANSTLAAQNEALATETRVAASDHDEMGVFNKTNGDLTQELDTLPSALELTQDFKNCKENDDEELKVPESETVKFVDVNSTSQMQGISNESELVALDVENKYLRRELDALRSSLSQVKETSGELTTSCIDDEDAKEACKEEVETLKTEINRLTGALDQLQSRFNDVQDTNVTLEEAIQDIQLEKEDIEMENEELATKLGDLTIQAKAMLARNEEMESQLAKTQTLSQGFQNQNVDHDDDDDADLISLREKYDEALEMIQQLKNDDVSIQKSHLNMNSNDETSNMKEEILELREVVDHLTGENQAAMQIKLIALELKTKNAELSESLRNSRENEKAIAFDNERLREQMLNEQSRMQCDDENRVVPYQENALTLTKDNHTEELEQYKAVLDQLMSDRALFTQRLEELMSINSHLGSAKEMSTLVEKLHDRNEGTASEKSSRALVLANAEPNVELGEQLQHLRIENGELAQRLGGAVAEKEFALSTLSKLGAKLEELHHRNKMLENIANLKSAHVVEVNRRDSFASSIMSSYYRLEGEDESRPPLCDLAESKPSLLDDQRMMTDFPVGLYPPSKPLEPEDADEKIVFDNCDQNEPQDPPEPTSKMQSDIGMTLIKFPGGEYHGQVNEIGQKHGRGRMTYENGNQYEGDWISNKRDGNGTTKYASGNMYVGAWKEGKRHGFGIFHIKKTGDVYRGNWERGLKHGAGVYEYADGELDVSVYHEDIRIGEGIRWNASRSKASRLLDGVLVEEEGAMPLEDAELLTKKLGFIL